MASTKNPSHSATLTMVVLDQDGNVLSTPIRTTLRLSCPLENVEEFQSRQDIQPSWMQWVGLDQPGDDWPWVMEAENESMRRIRESSSGRS